MSIREYTGDSPLQIGLLGFGTVGKAAEQMLEENRDWIERRAGGPLAIKRILVRHPGKHRDDARRLTVDPFEVLDDPDIRIVVEVMGGMDPARHYILEALRRGKTVITANKEVMSSCGQEIFRAGDVGRADIFFEASVCGGIPIIYALKESLAANRIRSLIGIVNGTTNYILSKMTHEGWDFAPALEDAQAKGYAEADPSADVEGHDAARKLAILASIAFGSRVTPNQVYTEGIERVTARDIQYARELGWSVKLLAIAKEGDEGLEVRVHPTFLPQDHPLAAVSDAFNAIYVDAEPLGEAMFYGRGAGGKPTASAILGDVVAAARNLRSGGRAVSCTCHRELSCRHMSEVSTGYYLRLAVFDRPGVLARVAQALGDQGVSLTSVLQKLTQGDQAELVLITHRAREKDVQAAVAELRQLAVVTGILNLIRIEGVV